jgi:hypothetical protein
MSLHCPSGFETSSWVAMRWERPTRYYRAHLEQDLWGHWILTRVVGRRDGHRGRYMTTWVPSLEHGLITLGSIAKRRRECGYRLVSSRPGSRVDGSTPFGARTINI